MIEHALLSRVGSRTINEDAAKVCERDGGLLCILADGLGGHGGGQLASRLAVETAAEVYRAGGHAFAELLPHCAQAAQDALLAAQRETERANQGMKTTLALLTIKDGRARWAHVGDSRIYRFAANGGVSRSKDHSVPQVLCATGEITEEEIRFHEDRNRLTRSLGSEWDKPKYTLSEEAALQPPEAFLLCSDGFWEYIVEAEMRTLLAGSGSAEEWLSKMERAVRKNGRKHDMDNYSAIAVLVR